MALMDALMGAIANPGQQGNLGQVANIFGMVQQMTGNQPGLDAGTTATAMSALGGLAKSALQQKQAEGGMAMVEALLNQHAGTSPSEAAVSALFGQGQQQQVAQTIAQKTGLDANMVLGLLPMAVPLVLQLLQQGASKQAAAPGSNSVLNAFMDGDRDGDVDFGDLLGQASKFLG
jgi:hypothetical protein